MKRSFYVAVFWFAACVHAQHCRIAGQVFFADPIDHTISLKTDAGDLVNFNYDDATNFLIAGSGPQQGTGAKRIPAEGR